MEIIRVKVCYGGWKSEEIMFSTTSTKLANDHQITRSLVNIIENLPRGNLEQFTESKTAKTTNHMANIFIKVDIFVSFLSAGDKIIHEVVAFTSRNQELYCINFGRKFAFLCASNIAKLSTKDVILRGVSYTWETLQFNYIR